MVLSARISISVMVALTFPRQPAKSLSHQQLICWNSKTQSSDWSAVTLVQRWIGKLEQLSTESQGSDWSDTTLAHWQMIKVTVQLTVKRVGNCYLFCIFSIVSIFSILRMFLVFYLV